MSDERPWEDYPDPFAPAAPPPASATPTVGYGEDIGKGLVGGFGRGVAGLAGLPGAAGNLIRAGLSKAGVSDEHLDEGAKFARGLPVAQLFAGPDPAQYQKSIEDYTGKFYEPQTVPGQYASTIGEFAPSSILGGGGVAARVLNTVAPAIASETAGQWTKGTAAEPWARGIAGIVAAPVAGKLVTPAAPASAAHDAAVAVLDREGIPLTAGQRTGSKPIQWMESSAADMPGSAGRAQELSSAQANAFDRAVTERLYDPAELSARGVPEGVNLPDPRVVVAGKQSLQDEYTRLSQNNELVSDPRLHSDLMAAQTGYERNVLPSLRNRDVEAIRNDIVDNLVQGQGRMPGDVYQTTRSRLGTLGNTATNPYEGQALLEMRGALDNTMRRGLPPDEAAAWALNNRRYANMKQTEGAVARAGENLSPQAVAQTARAGRAGQYAARAGDLDELASAASTIMKPLQNSGTAARLGWQQLFNLPALMSAGGGGVAGGLLGGPLGALAGAVAPFAASRAALSRPAQAYLGNRLIPQNARDAVTQALVEQATSQPDVILRNEDERAAYEQQRKDDRSKAGLPDDAPVRVPIDTTNWQ